MSFNDLFIILVFVIGALFAPMIWSFVKDFAMQHSLILRDMSSKARAQERAETDEYSSETDVKNTGETVKYAVAKRETSDFTFPDIFTGLARLVVTKQLTETIALKIACGVNAGKDPKYKAAVAALHEAMDEIEQAQQPAYRPLDAHSRPVLKER